MELVETQPVELLSGRWYSTEELAELLGVDPSSLRRWRTSRPAQRPPFVRLSSRVTVYLHPDQQSVTDAAALLSTHLAAASGPTSLRAV